MWKFLNLPAQVSTAALGLLKGRDVHFRNVEDLNEKFGSNPLRPPMLRYGEFPKNPTAGWMQCLPDVFHSEIQARCILVDKEIAGKA